MGVAEQLLDEELKTIQKSGKAKYCTLWWQWGRLYNHVYIYLFDFPLLPYRHSLRIQHFPTFINIAATFALEKCPIDT